MTDTQGLLATSTPPVEVWTDGRTVVLKQQPEVGELQEVRIPAGRLPGLIRELSEIREEM